jgi:hypothetical protein
MPSVFLERLRRRGVGGFSVGRTLLRRELRREMARAHTPGAAWYISASHTKAGG